MSPTRIAIIRKKASMRSARFMAGRFLNFFIFVNNPRSGMDFYGERGGSELTGLNQILFNHSLQKFG